MKLQALDYLKKPIDLDELLMTLEKALDRVQLDQRLKHSRQREQNTTSATELLGDSAAARQIREQIERIGQLSDKTDATPPTVLILGETGTGKDLVARCLHQASARRNRPFVHIDCAALPKELIEAELFGHEKGAFTSAGHARTGLIEAAEDGTVFLDEIGELPLELQTKLLAVLERRALRRVGSSREHSTTAWFIAATNRNLENMVATGEFRSDLYYRLKILTLSVPPLRERGHDVVIIARHFAAQVSHRYGLPASDLSDDAVAALIEYRWPGNIRELVNLIERAVILSGGGMLNAADLMLEPKNAGPVVASATRLNQQLTLNEAEAMLIEQALQNSGGNVSEAARQLGITRMALRYRLQKYGIIAKR
jgi:DNA-binding NtrC family response regulator